jgi:hypothetical protein
LPEQRVRYALEAPRVDRNWCCCLCGRPASFNVSAEAPGDCDSALCREVFPAACGAALAWAGETGLGGTPTTRRGSVVERCRARHAMVMEAYGHLNGRGISEPLRPEAAGLPGLPGGLRRAAASPLRHSKGNSMVQSVINAWTVAGCSENATHTAARTSPARPASWPRRGAEGGRRAR